MMTDAVADRLTTRALVTKRTHYCCRKPRKSPLMVVFDFISRIWRTSRPFFCKKIFLNYSKKKMFSEKKFHKNTRITLTAFAALKCWKNAGIMYKNLLLHREFNLAQYSSQHLYLDGLL